MQKQSPNRRSSIQKSLNQKKISTKIKQNSTRNMQTDMFPKEKSAYGGVLRNTRKGRQGSRKLSTKYTMHLVLRSSKARGEWSFTKPQHKSRIRQLITKHAHKNFIQILSVAIVGNHMHLHIKLRRRDLYKPFIRAITGAIALAVMGASRIKAKVKKHSDRFWDYRPFTTFVDIFRHFLNMKDYMRINQFEGRGFTRVDARMILAQEFDLKFARSDNS